MRTKLATCMIAAVLLLGAACGSSNDKSSTAGSGSQSADTTAAGSGGSASAPVKTSDSSLGKILTTDTGMTLYAFLNDKDGVSNCNDSCASAWPPLTTDSASLPAGLDSNTFKVIARSDGTHQIAAGDQPLYTFSNDKAAGDTNGQGIGSVWFVVNPDGTVNKAEAGTDTTAASSSKGPGY